MQAVLEGRHDAEIAAAAAQRPEQVRIVGGIGLAEHAVRGDHIGRDQVIDREPVLAHQPAQPAAERQTSDARVGDRASCGGESEHLGLAVQFAPEHTALGSHRSALRVHTNALHWRHVDDEAAVVGAVARRAVATAAHRDAETMNPREIHRALHIGNAGAARNQRRPPIDVAVPHPARHVVASMPRLDQLAAKGLPEALEMLRRSAPGHPPPDPQE